MRMPLPSSLNTLRTFSVAAKHLSFKAAADELCLSPSAVSRQIAGLEDQIGCKLFQRQVRGLALTPEGTKLSATLESVFDQLHSTLEIISPHNKSKSEPLVISAQPYFANHWLLPRLHRFKHQYPNVLLQFESELTYKPFDANKIDGCFRFTPPIDKGLHVKKLFRQFAVPVAAPVLLNKSDWNGDLRCLSAFNWCHTLSQPDLWQQWTDAWGLPNLLANENMFFDDADTALQAAKNGIGVAMAAWPLVEATVTAGHLVRLSDCHPQLYSDYYFICAKSNHDSRLQLFINWLNQEMAVE